MNKPEISGHAMLFRPVDAARLGYGAVDRSGQVLEWVFWIRVLISDGNKLRLLAKPIFSKLE